MQPLKEEEPQEGTLCIMKPPGGYHPPLRGFVILEIKVIGPITEQPDMGCAFAKTSPEREFFEENAGGHSGD
jgi:Uma2 family endonuclease